MAYQVEIVDSARRDLAEIRYWAFGNSPEAESVWLDELQVAVLSLGHLPFRCPLAPESRQSIRVLLVGGRPHVYRILYRIYESKGLVRILHIRHGSRQDLKLT